MRGRFTFFQPDNHLFSNIDGSNVWFKTMLLPSDTRFTYVLSENDPVGVRPRGKWSRKVQQDPLNPTRVPENVGDPNVEWRSSVRLPDAPEQPWYANQSQTSPLQLTKVRLKSKILNNERDVLIHAARLQQDSFALSYAVPAR